jgi:hypothetical protein
MHMNQRPWKRLAALRSARRRLTEIPPPEEHPAEPLPALECPDDDREFVQCPSQRWQLAEMA